MYKTLFDHLYELAIRLTPKHVSAPSLYGRGLAKQNGDAVGGNAYTAAAKAIRAGVAEYFERLYGVPDGR